MKGTNKLITFLLCGWAFLFIFTTYNSIVILINKNGYQNELFIVTKLCHDFDDNDFDYFAIGIVNGNRESFSLNRCFSSNPRTYEQLNELMPLGTEIDVLYNPSLSKAHIQGETLRVLKAEPNYFQDRKNDLYNMIVIGYGPIVIWLVLLLILRKGSQI